MQTLEIQYAQEHFHHLLHALHAGDEYLITENNKPLARLLPVDVKTPSIANIQKIKKFRHNNVLGMDLSLLIHKGRR